MSTKLRRDIGANKYQFISIIIVIFLGITLFAAAQDSYNNLLLSYKSTHEALGFADLTFGPTRFNDNQLGQVKKSEGVLAATGRITSDIPIKLSSNNKILGRAIGYPTAKQPAVNKLSIFTGAYFKPGDKYKVVVEKHFAEAHNLSDGDKIKILLPAKGKIRPAWRQLTVIGTAISPEYIWVTKSRQDVMPSPDNFGVLFVPQKLLRDSIGALNHFNYNELAVLLKSGADDGAVKARIQKISGFDSSVPVLAQKDQPGNAALKEDLDGFNEMSVFFPFVFLSISAMAIYIMLTRLVHVQRAQIGVLRANGYSRKSIVIYYLAFGLIVGTVGSVIGVVAGIAAGGSITRIYTSMLAIPIVKTKLYPETIFTGVLIAVISTLIGVWAPARTASRIKPAAAMRGETPAGGGRRSLWEKFLPFLKRLAPQWKIPLRGLGRNRRRSLSTIIGVIFAIVLILMSWGMLDTINYLLDRQFKHIQTQDLVVYFAQPKSAAKLRDIGDLAGIKRLEPLVELPLNLKHGNQHYATVLRALPGDTHMRRFYLAGNKEVKLEGSGLLVGASLKNKLDIKVGDSVQAKVMGRPLKFKIAGFINEAMGTFAYVNLAALEKKMPAVKNNYYSAQIKVGANERRQVKKRIAKLPDIVGIEDSRTLFETIQKFNKLFYGFVGVMLAFGGIMAFALIFNTMTVNIFERRREIATLKTLGIGKRRISYLITLENFLLVVIGTIPGLPIGYYMSKMAMNEFSSDLFSFDLHIFPLTYLYTALIIIAIALVSQWPALKAVHKLDLAKVIKERST